MKILLINRYSLEKTTGGVAEFLYYLPLALKSHGIQVLAYNEDSNNTGVLQGPTHSENGLISYAGPFIKPGFFVSAKKLKPLLELCRAEKIDLLHAQGAYRCGFIAMQASKRCKIPYLVTSHADIVSTNSDRMKRSYIRKRCAAVLKHAAAVSHLTPRMAEIANQIYDTQSKSTIIGNGIDLAGWQPVLNMTEKNYMLALGRLEVEKGFHVLISAFALLMQAGKKISLVIAGSGSAEQALHQQAYDLGLNVVTSNKDLTTLPDCSIVFTGYIRGDTKKRLIGECQFLLFPTQPALWEEPFGIVQIEAMAARKALVASDSSTTRYLQTLGLQSLLAKADSPQDWCKQITVLLDNERLRREFAELNLAGAKQFDWVTVADQYAKMYADCLAKSKESGLS